MASFGPANDPFRPALGVGHRPLSMIPLEFRGGPFSRSSQQSQRPILFDGRRERNASSEDVD